MRLQTDLIADKATREAVERLRDDVVSLPFRKGSFKFFEIELTIAVTNFKYRHGLGFIPKDVIQTSLIGAGSIVWNYSRFTKENLDISTTGPCVVRVFIGAYAEGVL